MSAAALLAALAPAFSAPLATNGSALPSVCIMIPTANRPEFVARALDMILEQRYPSEKIEAVVIVDDSPSHHRAAGLKAGLQSYGGLNVHYLPLTEPLAIGAKRNLTAKTCTGDVVVHWDDDDIYGPQRLATQLAPLAADGEADVTLLEHSLTYCEPAAAAVPPPGPHMQPARADAARARACAVAREDRLFAAFTEARSWGAPPS